MQTLERGTGAATSPEVDLDAVAPLVQTEEEADLYGDDLEPLTPEEEAEMNAEIEAYRRAELCKADKEAADARFGMRENIIAQYGTPENYYHSVGCAGDEDEIARIFALGKTWMEPQNIRRRADGRTLKVKRETQLVRLVAYKAQAQPEPALMGRIVRMKAPANPEAPKPVKAPATDARAAIKAIYAAAIKAHPKLTAKLTKSLEWQLGEYDNTLAHFAAKGKTEAEAVTIWESRARLACEAKTR